MVVLVVLVAVVVAAVVAVVVYIVEILLLLLSSRHYWRRSCHVFPTELLFGAIRNEADNLEYASKPAVAFFSCLSVCLACLFVCLSVDNSIGGVLVRAAYHRGNPQPRWTAGGV